MDKMMVKDFVLDFNQETKTWHVYYTKDELTKNHKDPGQLQSGFMPGNMTNHLCLVHSFKEYMDHLHP